MERKVYEFISKKTSDPIVEWKICKVSGTEFPIYKSDLEFYDKISPVFNGVKYQIPTPTLCPEERQRRRLSRRNERKLYKRKCDLSGKDIVSTYNPYHISPVYSLETWFGDKWDATTYGREFDFNKTFFEQFDELNKVVPKISLIYDNNENCEYTNGVGDSKNCYLIFGGISCEECMYGRPYNSYKCIDCFLVRDSEICYECIDSNKLYDCKFCKNCHNSSNLEYCIGVENSQNCFLCTGLKNKSYYIENKYYDKDLYKHKVKELKKLRHEELEYKLKILDNKTIKNQFDGYNNETTIGDYCYNTKNCIITFDVGEVEDGKYITYSTDTKDIMSSDYGEHANLLYENCGYFKINKTSFSCMNWAESSDLLYCYMCYNNVKNCFACIGIQNKEYCILNKQYTKHEYEQLVPKIIEHMKNNGERGEFFPISISPYGYNETSAQEYYPLIEEEAISKGYKRMSKEIPINIPLGLQTINGENLDVKNYNDSILNKAIICSETGKPFRIIRAELDFYKKYELPIPTLHPEKRHLDRLKKRNSRTINVGICSKCKTEMITTHQPNISERIYCESCYKKEIYG